MSKGILRIAITLPRRVLEKYQKESHLAFSTALDYPGRHLASLLQQSGQRLSAPPGRELENLY